MKNHPPACRVGVPVACLALAFCAVIAGCGAERQIAERDGYPAGVAQGPTLDIQVVRHATTLEMTNTTARTLGSSTIWLNRWHSKHIDGLSPGQSLTIPLREFLDRYGEPFRGGGFWAIQRPDRLGVVEIQTAGPDGEDTMLGLVVVNERD
jgi:hypothetical protein